MTDTSEGRRGSQLLFGVWLTTYDPWDERLKAVLPRARTDSVLQGREAASSTHLKGKIV